MPLGSDATEQMPTGSWTELAHQTPASQVRLSEWSNAYLLPDSYEQGTFVVIKSLSLGDHLGQLWGGLYVATCRVGNDRLWMYCQ